VDFLIVQLTEVIMSIVMFEADVITNLTVGRKDFKTSGSFIRSYLRAVDRKGVGLHKVYTSQNFTHNFYADFSSFS